ncbi:hypothetical protein LTR36_002554 [Oleoguttula mirabilis]|uniref:DUF4870 domain-containing protein n=1 Tax=Oleoguttula mirabilis TaxID=1507867 RepID=A0AAV9JL39_9PEZI|nr:hypothetical protein LTR36_002554 [Oleoguttula mirabilis]
MDPQAHARAADMLSAASHTLAIVGSIFVFLLSGAPFAAMIWLTLIILDRMSGEPWAAAAPDGSTLVPVALVPHVFITGFAVMLSWDSTPMWLAVAATLFGELCFLIGVVFLVWLWQMGRKFGAEMRGVHGMRRRSGADGKGSGEEGIGLTEAVAE